MPDKDLPDNNKGGTVRQQYSFREVVPQTEGAKLRARIHAGGRIAILVDARGCSEPAACIEDLGNLLDELPAETSAKDAFELLISDAEAYGATVNVIHVDGSHCEVAGRRPNPMLRFMERSRAGVALQEEHIPLDRDALYATFIGDLDIEPLCRRVQSMVQATTVADFTDIGRRAQKSPEWAMLVINPGRNLSFVNPAWPYNPFVGRVEEFEHEKKGLAAIADALFREKDFAGFRIVGGIHTNTQNTSHLRDGVLISPWGVVLLELKNHFGKVELWEANDNRSMKITPSDGRARLETSPLPRLEKSSRVFSSEYNLGVSIAQHLRQVAALVFTHPDTKVILHTQGGATRTDPYRAGRVIICKPSSLASELRDYVRNRAAGLLDQATIERIVEYLADPTAARDSRSIGNLVLGRFQIASLPIAEESTSIVSVYEAVTQDTHKKAWAKRYAIDMLSREDGYQKALERVSREIAILQDLGKTPGVQGYFDKFDRGTEFYVIVERVEGERLGSWLQARPTRGSRLALLRKLAKILAALSEQGLAHRAITPANIRVDREGSPTLINFDLSCARTLATISPDARNLLDSTFLPPEALHAGEVLTSACDTYSYGKIVALVLAGRLPFETYVEQQRAQIRPGFWEAFSKECGLEDSQSASLKRMLALDPTRRPVGNELVEIVAAWE